jgi:hypothetical protein
VCHSSHLVPLGGPERPDHAADIVSRGDAGGLHAFGGTPFVITPYRYQKPFREVSVEIGVLERSRPNADCLTCRMD